MLETTGLHPLREVARSLTQQYLDVLEALVSRESPTADKAAADALVDELEALAEAEGWLVQRHEAETVGDQLVARRSATGTMSTLLLCHYDTVWECGTLGEMPFVRQGDKVFGPGILDMKAGIASAILAPAVVRKAGHELSGPVTLLITSDEERGSEHSRALIEQLAVEHDRVFVLEPGTDAGALKVGRKGTAAFFAELNGVSAHAGVNPEHGASALRELAHFVMEVEELADEALGTTVNVTVARAGTVGNVIAERAHAEVDARVLNTAEAERIERAIKGYVPSNSRVEVKVVGGLNRPPLEQTAANRRLFEEARQRAAELGVRIEGSVVGGASDGNFTSAMGVPTLDGLGAVGAGPHARHEHIRLATSLDRMALLAALLRR